MFTNKNLAVIIGLLIFFVIIFFLGNSLKDAQELTENVKNLEHQVENLKIQFEQQTTALRREINKLKNQDLWWSMPIFEFQELDEDQMLVRVSWQIKELVKNNEVKFNYLLAGESQFNHFSAREESPGFFVVTIPLKIPQEPIINIHFSRDSDRKDRKATPNITREFSGKDQVYNIQYYISLQKDDKTLTSQIYNYNLKQLSYQLFNPLQVHLSLTGNNDINVSISENTEAYSSRRISPFKIKKIFLQTKSGGKIKDTWKTKLYTPPDYRGDDKFYTANSIPADGNYESLYIIIEYSQGFTFEKEIYTFK